MKKALMILFLLCLTVTYAFADCKNTCKKAAREIEITNDNELYIIRVPHEKISVIKPHITKLLAYNKDVFAETNAEIVVNGGYFDPKNHGTASYIIIDKKIVLDPKTNESLMANSALQPFLPQILNRTEFRVLDCRGQLKFDIVPHEAPVPNRCEILHSMQAGPELYPQLKLEEEYFVVKKDGKVTRDSISSLKKCARTAIGIKGNDVYLIIATVQHRMTLSELTEVCRKLNLDKAMNFDGGGSTSLNFRGTYNDDYKNFEITSDKDKNARKLKSFLLIN